jgi:glyoxylase-like metal-dependent hydrolase (beta-lactamase superfamily II)/rhodanese-related sulfurtransferase
MHMPDYVDASTLRDWLEQNRPVTIIDVRADEDRAQWSIPGSIHVNAYEALKAGEPSVLSDIELPPDRPVVTVCNLGRVSARAAEVLAGRGIAALSLAGGMKAWSLAWNTAEVTLSKAQIVQVRRTGKGCLSYVVFSGSEALVIDASLPAEVYLDLATEKSSTIRHVLDTHIHADHLSRSRLLAEKSGATLSLPRQNRVAFPYTPIDADSELVVGDAVVRAIPTPGHTMESTSYFINGHALFTGDTLFLAGVGRPDLHTNATESAARASLLYRSLKKLLALGPEVLVFPGHTSEPVPFDRRVLSARLGDIAARLQPWLSSEETFTERLLAHLPETPPNYLRIVDLNEAGELSEGDVTDLEAGANRCAVPS